MVKRRDFVIALGAGALAPFASFAQQRGKVWRVGMLSLQSKKFYVDSGYEKLFLQGMREQGYAEGRDFVIEERFAEGEVGRLAGLVADLVRTKVDVIVSTGTQTTIEAQKGTSTIPIVTVAEADPIGNGFALSLARPGKNITGLSNAISDTYLKNLEFLKVIVPRLSSIAVLRNPSNAAMHKRLLGAIEPAARKVGIKVLAVDAGNPEEIERAIAAMSRKRVQALAVLPDSIFTQQVGQIAQLTLKHRLPSAYTRHEFPEAGGLLSYGNDITVNYRLGAKFIDKIFKGAKPGELPFEQPTIFELAVNMKTAKALGLKIPNLILVQATKVIE